ncbi:DCMP deaminase [Aphelenchoides avenae]|nr:DCMP deaminase [Aphelenchus avenae]
MKDILPESAGGAPSEDIRQQLEATSLNLTEVNGDSKRSDYISWDEFFMGTALLSARRSKDPCTQVGCAIVNQSLRIVGIGYNGMPHGCSDDAFPWGKSSANPLENKYMYVCHAEMNAILNKNIQSAEGCTLYCTMFPCNECAKMIIQSGIKRVVYFADKPNKPEMIASKRLFDVAKIAYERFIPQRSQIVLNFEAEQ